MGSGWKQWSLKRRERWVYPLVTCLQVYNDHRLGLVNLSERCNGLQRRSTAALHEVVANSSSPKHSSKATILVISCFIYDLRNSDTKRTPVIKVKLKLTNSPLLSGTKMFISDDLAVTICAATDCWLRYTMQPSVLSIETVGTLPRTWQTTSIYDETDYFLLLHYSCMVIRSLAKGWLSELLSNAVRPISFNCKRNANNCPSQINSGNLHAVFSSINWIFRHCVTKGRKQFSHWLSWCVYSTNRITDRTTNYLQALFINQMSLRWQSSCIKILSFRRS